MAETLWDWLGEHLAVDVLNTVQRRGDVTHELLNEPQDLSSWLGHQAHRAPVPEPVDAELLEEFVAVRDAALNLARASVKGRLLPGADVETINVIASRSPIPRLLGTHAGAAVIPPSRSGSQRDDLLATLAAAIIDLLSDPNLRDLSFCDAPSCGQYFHRSRPNQRWCCARCGDRARSARSYRGPQR